MLPLRQGDSSDTTDALLFLAHYHKRLRDYDKATQYCNRLLDLGGRVRGSTNPAEPSPSPRLSLMDGVEGLAYPRRAH